MNIETTAQKIHCKLTKSFAPTLLEITDESALHAGHSGHSPTGETHFRVAIVSPAFKSLTKVAAHRAIYQTLAEEMKEGGIHALALDVRSE